MINPSNVAKIFADQASNLLLPVSSTTSGITTIITNREYEVAHMLCDVLESMVNSHSHSFEVETTLDHESSKDEMINEAENENDEVDDSFESDYLGQEEEDEETELCKKFSLEYMTRAANFYDEINPKTGQRKRRWSTVKHHFKRIPHQSYMTRFRHYLEKQGTKKQKMDKIDDYVFDMFERAREKSLSVHEIDLRRWAIKKAMDESLHDFVASSHWLHTFKYKHDIVSRKVTKIVTKRETQNQETIKVSADRFVADVRERLQKYETSEVMNTDQSGIELELHSTRTLSYKGEKLTVAAVRSTNASTHSYTVQPTITLDGHLLSPVYLCLKEPKGHMSENIRSHLFKASNVVVTCSSSGKLTTSLVEYWRDHVFIPSLGQRKKSLLISDCWGGQTDSKGLYNNISGCTRLEIPQKTTSQIQPLDVFFNRQMKVIPRRIYDRVMLDEVDINMSERNNIIRLISLTHNQLSSKIFYRMIQYAWYASGYTDTDPSPFKTIAEVCFSFNDPICVVPSCDAAPFILLQLV